MTSQLSSPPGRLRLAPLMFTAFSGTVAMMAFVAIIGPIARLLQLEPWHVGLVVTVAGIAWMTMARVWGVLSDRLGRRRVLLTGLAGFAITYAALTVFMGLALSQGFGLLAVVAGITLGRTVAGGFFAAVPPVCAAIIADHVPPAGRARAMGTLGAANALGMVLGPGAAGLLAAWSLSASLYLIAILPVLALIVVWQTLPADSSHKGRPPSALKLVDPRIRRVMLVAFTAMFSVVIAQVVIGFFALDRIGAEPQDAARIAGIALACVGGALFLSQMILRTLSWPPMRFIRIGGVVAAIGFSAVAFVDSAPALWAAYAFAASGMGWVYPSLSALAANSVEAHEQGAAAGAVAGAQGLGTVLGPIIGTGLYQLAPGAPFVLVGGMLLLAALWPNQTVRP